MSRLQLQQPCIETIPRVQASEFCPSKHYFHYFKDDSNNDQRVPYETPVIIENVFNSDECEAICEAILSNLGSAEITVQRKRKSNKKSDDRTDMYQCTLDEAFDLMMRSNHSDSFFSFCEGLLDNVDENSSFGDNDLDYVKETMYLVREELFGNQQCDGSANNRKEDWFPYFPPEIRPTDCLVLAGEGATSTLHRDPFEWTGLSLCLEGSKVWRFIPPPVADVSTSPDSFNTATTATCTTNNDNSGVDIIDGLLNSYRLESIAWDNDHCKDDDEHVNKRIPLSAGWQSNKSLFAHRRRDGFKSPRSLADMDDESRSKYLESIAMDPRALMTNINDSTNIVDKTTFGADEYVIDDDGRAIPKLWTTVQKPGDMLVIPAYWWHQTYALEPSLAIASQRCGSDRDANRVANHMLNTSRIKKDKELAMNEWSGGDCPKVYVDALFRYISLAKVKATK